jgi:Ca-activated chloride channel homolog
MLKMRVPLVLTRVFILLFTLLTPLTTLAEVSIVKIKQAGKAAKVIEFEGAAQVLLILDLSGSMGERLLDGTPKLMAAKEAINSLMQELPATVKVGLRVYGGSLGAFNPCSDSRLLVPIQTTARDKIEQALPLLQATGPTPISYSLVNAVKHDFPYTDRPKNIILVSDGEETCSSNPCPVVLELLRQNKGLTIDVIAFGHLADGAFKQLNCVATATFGRLVKATTALELKTQLSTLLKGKQVVTGRLVKTYTTPVGSSGNRGQGVSSVSSVGKKSSSLPYKAKEIKGF